MTEQSSEIIDDATPEELISCIQLLAISVAQHRAKCGFVTLSESTEQIQSPPNEAEAEEVGLFGQSKEVLEEALEIVRTLAAQATTQAVPEKEASEGPQERRTQFRIRISAPIRLLWPQDSKPVEADLKDISWGGASIHVDEGKVHSGDKIRIILPRPQGGSISIESKVIRTWQRSDGAGLGIATRFCSLSTRDADKLEDILDHMVQSADNNGQRQHARLTHRLDIQFDGTQELQSTLDDISTGGLGITMPDPLQLGQSLQAVISTLDESCSLKLRARVVRQEKQKLGNVEVYAIGLKFEHPTEELKKRTSALIREIATTKV